MEKVLIDLENNGWAPYLNTRFGVKEIKIIKRSFPDGETYLKIPENVKGKEVIIVCSLDQPNAKTLDLLLLSRLLRANGAERVGLIAPYLAYMRQDKVFTHGEGITASYFAGLISEYFSWLITVDPHLHRIHHLSEIYTIPALVAHAAPYIGAWIKENIKKPLIIGPDHESSQWVKETAAHINAPFEVLEKIRESDTEVHESAVDMKMYKGRTPILVDDIISTGQTMIETIRQLKRLHAEAPVCIAVHGLFSGNAFFDLINAGAADIITCNTVRSATNRIDVCQAVEALM